MIRVLRQNLIELARHLLAGFGIIFLFVESFEVASNKDVLMPYLLFLTVGAVPGVILFVVDGYYFGGFLRDELVVPTQASETEFKLKYGDMFEEDGWKAIGVNDFFDSAVDEDLVSSGSLHGYVLNTFWGENIQDWRGQVQSALSSHEGEPERRTKGNRKRYPIGTTVRASSKHHEFLFVALGKANPENYVTTANTEMLIKAVRGMAKEARAACSTKPLIVPLMGNGLARTNMPPTVLIDLILTALVEESRHGKITHEIRIVLHSKLKKSTNLKNHARKWAHAK